MSNSDLDCAKQKNDPLLPGFDPPPTEALAPPLPGMAAQPLGSPAPVIHHQPEKASLELHPPAKKRAALAAQAAQAAQAASRKTAFRVNATIALSALSCALGIGLIAACLGLLRSPEVPVSEVPNDIPLALLPDTADPTLWDIVSKMSGEINGVPLQFEHGLATDDSGRVYKLQLDFCRSGADIYAKVAGDRTFVVRLDEQGRIAKAYPAPKNNKPLKDIFGK